MKKNTATPCGLTVEQVEKIKAAVHLAGGQLKVAKAMGYRFGESVRRFTAGLKLVPAERVSDFREAIENRLTLAEIRPDLYGGVSPDQLGEGKAAQ